MDRLNELLQELGLSKVKLAKYLGVSRQMVYNYLVLDSLDKWPKEKKVLLLQLLDIKDGSKKSIESIVVDTDYLMEVEKRLNNAIKQTNSIESAIDMNGLTKENKQLVNDFIFLIKEKFTEEKNKDTYYTDQNIIDLIDKFNKNNIPISLIMLGNNWHSKNSSIYGLNWNKDLFIDYDKFINYLKNKDIHLGVTINPTILSDKEINIDKFIKENNLVTKDNKVPFNVYDKKIIESYFNIFIDPLINSGISSFLIDYTNIKDLNTLRILNYYHSKYFKNKNLRNNVFSRNGLINSHNTNIIYSGRTIVNWNILNKLPEYNSSASNMGISFISDDIGGYSGGIEDGELYRRYIEFGTFSPILRLSSASSHYYKREPWKWDIDTLTIVTYYLRLRYMLIPYLYTESINYINTGIPILRPVYYNYPEVYDEIEYRNEYYLGNNLFVCPITKPKDIIMNRTIHKMFLPNGIWYDFKTGIKYIGNKRYISFYKDEDYPVFATQGSIIPLGMIDENNINSTKNPKGFNIHIFPGKSNSYTICEDDGITLNKDNYVKTIIDYKVRSGVSRTNGIYTTTATTGNVPVYYYRGDADKVNNNIIFNNMCWKIIRTTETGGVKLIYNGTPANGKCEIQTGEATQIGTSAFNESSNDNAYVGYMYGTVGSTTYDATHKNINDSTIKVAVDKWYEDNLKTNYANYLADTLFCNDKTLASSSIGTSNTALGYGTNKTYYASTERLQYSTGTTSITTAKPTFKCAESATNDYSRFTVDVATLANGNQTNGNLKYPIGLLTADEVAFAGAYKSRQTNKTYYLYNSSITSNWWLSSPASSYGSTTFEWVVSGSDGYIFNFVVYDTYAFRPSINLKAELLVGGGDGTSSNPYTVKIS